MTCAWEGYLRQNWNRRVGTNVLQGSCESRSQRLPRLLRLSCKALNIDRRRHLELAWERQQKQEQLLSQIQPANITGRVQDLHNLRHLERVLEVSGGALCIIAFYSRSCGICRDVMSDFKELQQECQQQRARVVFLTHNVFDEFDGASDIARLYRIRSVPRFLFLVDGAVVRQVGMADARQSLASRALMRGRLDEDRRQLRRVLWELLVKNAPSARR